MKRRKTSEESLGHSHASSQAPDPGPRNRDHSNQTLGDSIRGGVDNRPEAGYRRIGITAGQAASIVSVASFRGIVNVVGLAIGRTETVCLATNERLV